MKCYTVSEFAAKGILPVEYEGELFFQVGQVPTSVIIPLGVEISKSLRLLRDHGYPWELHAADFSSDGERVIGEGKQKGRRPRDRRAMVLVQTTCGDQLEDKPPKLFFTARSYSERLSRKERVVKEWHPFIHHNDDPTVCDVWHGDPMPGVQIELVGAGHHGEPNALLVMHQDASFRMYRTGDVGDAPRQFNVKWDGRELSMWSPARWSKDRAYNQRVA